MKQFAKSTLLPRAVHCGGFILAMLLVFLLVVGVKRPDLARSVEFPRQLVPLPHRRLLNPPILLLLSLTLTLLLLAPI